MSIRSTRKRRSAFTARSSSPTPAKRTIAIRAGTAQLAEAYLKSTGIGDVAYFGPEAEFFLFDDVRYSNTMNKVSFEVDAQDAAWNTGTEYEMGNMGHRPGVKGGYFPVNPTDAAMDLRSEMLSTMKRIGMKVDKHHHEVASCQHELGLIFSSLTKQADELQKYKYVIHNVAHAYGKSATFMPKPIAGDNGTGMHVNMSIWKDGKPLFLQATNTPTCRMRRSTSLAVSSSTPRRLNAFTNPSTNSYKRLIPGFEAPVLRAYSARNRSGCVRIPWTESPKAKRVEARFPDPSANPYLAFAALLMAGLDGIENKIHPGEPSDKDLYDLPPEELAGIPTVCASLREALESLEGRSRLPAQGRRVHQGPDRGLHGAQVGRGLRLRAHPSPRRIRHVLQLLIDVPSVRKKRRGAGSAPLFLLVFACGSDAHVLFLATRLPGPARDRGSGLP